MSKHPQELLEADNQGSDNNKIEEDLSEDDESSKDKQELEEDNLEFQQVDEEQKEQSVNKCASQTDADCEDAVDEEISQSLETSRHYFQDKKKTYRSTTIQSSGNEEGKGSPSVNDEMGFELSTNMMKKNHSMINIQEVTNYKSSSVSNSNKQNQPQKVGRFNLNLQQPVESKEANELSDSLDKGEVVIMIQNTDTDPNLSQIENHADSKSDKGSLQNVNEKVNSSSLYNEDINVQSRSVVFHVSTGIVPAENQATNTSIDDVDTGKNSVYLTRQIIDTSYKIQKIRNTITSPIKIRLRKDAGSNYEESNNSDTSENDEAEENDGVEENEEIQGNQEVDVNQDLDENEEVEVEDNNIIIGQRIFQNSQLIQNDIQTQSEHNADSDDEVDQINLDESNRQSQSAPLKLNSEKCNIPETRKWGQYPQDNDIQQTIKKCIGPEDDNLDEQSDVLEDQVSKRQIEMTIIKEQQLKVDDDDEEEEEDEDQEHQENNELEQNVYFKDDQEDDIEEPQSSTKIFNDELEELQIMYRNSSVQNDQTNNQLMLEIKEETNEISRISNEKEEEQNVLSAEYDKQENSNEFLQNPKSKVYIPDGLSTSMGKIGFLSPRENDLESKNRSCTREVDSKIDSNSFSINQKIKSKKQVHSQSNMTKRISQDADQNEDDENNDDDNDNLYNVDSTGGDLENSLSNGGTRTKRLRIRSKSRPRSNTTFIDQSNKKRIKKVGKEIKIPLQQSSQQFKSENILNSSEQQKKETKVAETAHFENDIDNDVDSSFHEESELKIKSVNGEKSKTQTSFKMKKSLSINISGNDKTNEPEIGNFEHAENNGNNGDSVDTGLDRTRFVVSGNNIKEIPQFDEKNPIYIHISNNFDNSIGLQPEYWNEQVNEYDYHDYHQIKKVQIQRPQTSQQINQKLISRPSSNRRNLTHQVENQDTKTLSSKSLALQKKPSGNIRTLNQTHSKLNQTSSFVESNKEIDGGSNKPQYDNFDGITSHDQQMSIYRKSQKRTNPSRHSKDLKVQIGGAMDYHAQGELGQSGGQRSGAQLILDEQLYSNTADHPQENSKYIEKLIKNQQSQQINNKSQPEQLQIRLNQNKLSTLQENTEEYSRGSRKNSERQIKQNQYQPRKINQMAKASSQQVTQMHFMNIHDEQEGNNLDQIEPKESRFSITPMLHQKENLKMQQTQENQSQINKKSSGNSGPGDTMYLTGPALNRGNSKFTVNSPMMKHQNPGIGGIEQIDEAPEHHRSEFGHQENQNMINNRTPTFKSKNQNTLTNHSMQNNDQYHKMYHQHRMNGNPENMNSQFQQDRYHSNKMMIDQRQMDFHQTKLDTRGMQQHRYGGGGYSYRNAMEFAFDQEQFLKNMQLEKEQQYHRERYLICQQQQRIETFREQQRECVRNNEDLMYKDQYMIEPYRQQQQQQLPMRSLHDKYEIQRLNDQCQTQQMQMQQMQEELFDVRNMLKNQSMIQQQQMGQQHKNSQQQYFNIINNQSQCYDSRQVSESQEFFSNQDQNENEIQGIENPVDVRINNVEYRQQPSRPQMQYQSQISQQPNMQQQHHAPYIDQPSQHNQIYHMENEDQIKHQYYQQ